MATIAFITAHPDDETFTSGNLIYEASQRGDNVIELVATLGDAGKTGRLGTFTREDLAVKRKQELFHAAELLGMTLVQPLSYADGQLHLANREILVNEIVDFINQHQVEVVFTFPEDGISGHKDHTAIHLATKEAILSGRCPSVQKLYYFASPTLIEQGFVPSVQLECSLHWSVKREALLAHESQIFSVERVFGDIQTMTEMPKHRKWEQFVLAWERGQLFPNKKETFVTAGLIEG